MKIDRNLSTYFSLDGKNIILYYSVTLTNLACTGCFQVIKFSFLMTNGHEILHIRVKLSEFYFNNNTLYLVFIFYSNKVVYESENCAV